VLTTHMHIPIKAIITHSLKTVQKVEKEQTVTEFSQNLGTNLKF